MGVVPGLPILNSVIPGVFKHPSTAHLGHIDLSSSISGLNLQCFHSNYFFLKFILHFYLFIRGQICHSTCVEIRGQLVGSNSFFPLCGSQGLNSGHKI